MQAVSGKTTGASVAPPEALPNIPWEDRPTGTSSVLWRDGRNPIIRRDHIERANSIFNSAVVPFEGEFAGVFRVDDTTRVMDIHAGFSIFAFFSSNTSKPSGNRIQISLSISRIFDLFLILK